MSLHSSFEKLSSVLKEFDQNGRSARRVEVTAEQHEPVSATVEISLSVTS